MIDFDPDPKTDEWTGSNYAPCCVEGMVSGECEQSFETVTVTPGGP